MINIPNAIRGHSRLTGAIDLKPLASNYRQLLYFYGIGGQRIISPNTTVYQTFTLSTWIKWQSGGGVDFYEIISKSGYYAGYGYDFPVSIRLQPTGVIKCGISDGVDWDYELEISSTQTLFENVWYHVAATYNNPDLIVYVNGESTAASGAVTLANNNLGWTFGNSAYDYAGGTNRAMFKGWILDPRVYSVAKSKNEIINIKNGYDDQDGLEVSFPKINLP